MIVTCSQMQQMEVEAFARGLRANDLMEQAGQGIASAVRQMQPKPGFLVLYLGKGNNAGDALVAARELQREGWRLLARLASTVDQFKPLP
ncbi:MAG: nnr, partial [Verrucomicrobiaceae bacterium]|nr:nnr [Verrucomicrobiaceae bacterium]